MKFLAQHSPKYNYKILFPVKNMVTKAFSRILGLFFRVLQKHRYPKHLHKKVILSSSTTVHATNHGRFQNYPSLVYRSDISNHTLIFNVEGALLTSSSLFSYFMLVAFEGGSLFRALVLFILYPFICMVSEEMGLKVMVMICFCGIKRDGFSVGRAVLPKFFLEDVGFEGFEVLKRGKRMVATTDMPRVMVESFLKDYMDIECVFGRELKVFCGYYVGLMEGNQKNLLGDFVEIFEEEEKMGCDVIGITSFNKYGDHDRLFSLCKEIYLTSKGERKKWHQLPRDNYPKPLIFHDGRLALKPTPLAILAIFMWIPFGLFLSIIRISIALSLPYKLSIPMLAFSGLQLKVKKPKKTTTSDNPSSSKNTLYVCNHRTLLDPLYLCFALKNDLTAVTYSLSRMSELLAPIKTVRLTRDRDQDAKMMEKLLNQGGLIVCPEGTTCREPYLLRFSPLFAEMSDDIAPVAMDSQVSMFYGTTASGLKFLDPIFFLMNPCPKYTINLLDKVSGSSSSSTCRDGSGESRFRVANHIQAELGKALGFECTKLTRKDKYLILAGNEGIASSTNAKPNVHYLNIKVLSNRTKPNVH